MNNSSDCSSVFPRLLSTLFLLSLLFLTEDSVFMENEIDRDEYVLADFGYIWVGSARRNEGIPWQFGQVRDLLLLTSSYLVHFAICL